MFSWWKPTHLKRSGDRLMLRLSMTRIQAESCGQQPGPQRPTGIFSVQPILDLLTFPWPWCTTDVFCGESWHLTMHFLVCPTTMFATFCLQHLDVLLSSSVYDIQLVCIGVQTRGPYYLDPQGNRIDYPKPLIKATTTIILDTFGIQGTE